MQLAHFRLRVWQALQHSTCVSLSALSQRPLDLQLCESFAEPSRRSSVHLPAQGRLSRRSASSYEGIKRAQDRAGSQRPRFYVPSEVLATASEGTIFKLGKEETRHALRVLRLREGDAVEVCDGFGRLQSAFIGGMSNANLVFVEATTPVEKVAWTGPKWQVVAAVGGLKGTRDDWLVEKACELGAWSFQPLLTHRSRTLGRQAARHKVKVVNVAALSDDEGDEGEGEVASTSQLERWRRVATAAAKQSLRAHTMVVHKPVTMARIAAQLQAAPVALVAAAGGPPVIQVLAESTDRLAAAFSPSASPVSLLVGPEGDFTGEELEALVGAGALPVGLGGNRLRVETAAISLLSVAALYMDSLQAHGDDQDDI